MAGATIALAGGVARGDQPALPAPTHTVRAGDTVWDIARAVAGPHEDPRPVVDRIVRENALDAGALQPGDVIVLPAL